MKQEKLLNTPAIRRMPVYLNKLLKLQQEGKSTVTSTELAKYVNIETIVVRKDLALTGVTGSPRLGYDVQKLLECIKKYLGWQDNIRAALIGAGSLGTALLGYDDFHSYGFHIESVFDSNTSKIGTILKGREVFDIDKMDEIFGDNPPQIAIICVSNAAAQAVVDKATSSGIKFIWNFANTDIEVPPGVVIQREVIAGGLAVLGVRMKQNK